MSQLPLQFAFTPAQRQAFDGGVEMGLMVAPQLYLIASPHPVRPSPLKPIP